VFKLIMTLDRHAMNKSSLTWMRHRSWCLKYTFLDKQRISLLRKSCKLRIKRFIICNVHYRYWRTRCL